MTIKNMSNLHAEGGNFSDSFNPNDFEVTFQNGRNAWSAMSFRPRKRLATLYYLSDPEDLEGSWEDFDLTETAEGRALIEAFEEGSLGDLLDAALTYTTTAMEWWR